MVPQKCRSCRTTEDDLEHREREQHGRVHPAQVRDRDVQVCPDIVTYNSDGAPEHERAAERPEREQEGPELHLAVPACR